MNKSHANKKLNQLPSWLWTNSTTLPPVYKMVWEAVREDRVRSNVVVQSEVLVDTNKVFPLLLTSQLPTEVLGHIWNLANQKYAGQLTEQELYVVLALVAAAQASYTFNSLDILHLLPFPPTPYLNIECLMNLQNPSAQRNASKVQHSNEQLSIIGADVEDRYAFDVKGRSRVKSQGNMVPHNTSISSHAPSDRSSYFDNLTQASSGNLDNLTRDVKQALSSTPFDESADEFTEFQSAPISNVTTVPMWDSKQGSAIGSRLANHNLGVKKPVDKTRRITATTTVVAGTKTVQVNTQIRTLAASAPYHNKDQPMEIVPDLFPKCAMKSQSKTVILKDTAIRSNEPLKNYGDSFSNTTSTSPEATRAGDEKEISPKLESVTKAATVDTPESAQQDLMSLQLVEDKYSALRALVQEMPVVGEAGCLNLTYNSQSADEFGEFMSAEQPVTGSPVPDVLDTESFGNVFADFVLKTHGNADNGSLTDLNLASDVSESFDNLKLDDGIEGQLVEAGKSLQKEDAISINSVELISGPSETLPRSGSVPSLDLKSFLPSNVEDDQAVEAPQNIYSEWKQYMESCVLLLQVAANIFTNITSELVLHEVLNSAQGYNFLCRRYPQKMIHFMQKVLFYCDKIFLLLRIHTYTIHPKSYNIKLYKVLVLSLDLAEVAAVCRRVNFSYKELDINITGFDDLLMDIDRIWAEMEPFYANIPIVTELPAWPLHQGECISCSLCLTVITSSRVVYNDNNYHATCANLWLNCVNNQLPVMRYSVLYPQSNICPGSHI